MKTVTKALLTLFTFAAATLAVDTQYKTRFITSATLTIHVKDGQYITIKNFTQDQDVGNGRGVIDAGLPPPSPTPTPTVPPTPTPTLSTNAGPGVALSTGAKLTDTATLFGDTNPTGVITFTLQDPSNAVVDTEMVTVNGNGNYNTPNGFSPTVVGTYMWSAIYSGDSNNNPATDNGQNESEIVTATPAPTPTPTPTPTSTPTPTPIKAGVLTAALLKNPPLEFVKPITIAGPATLTIDPVPGATLTITYRKSLQPIQSTATASPTPSSISTRTSTSTSSATTTTSVGTSKESSRSDTAIESTSSDEDDIDWSTPTATPTPTLTPTPTPTLTPSPVPTATP